MGAIAKGKRKPRNGEITVDLAHLFDGLADILEGQFAKDSAGLSFGAIGIAERLNREAIKVAKEGDHVFTREYIESFDVIAEWGDEIGADSVNSAPWAVDLEIGQPPGRRADYENLRKWVLFKWVARGKCEPDEADKVTRNIQRKIQEFGTEPHFIMREAMGKAPKFIQTEMRRALPGGR